MLGGGGGSLTAGFFANTFNFVNVESKKGTKTVLFSKKAPKWRICCRGLNMQGTCSNDSC